MLVFLWSESQRIYLGATFSLAFTLNLFLQLSTFENIAITLNLYHNKPRTI